MIVAKWGNSLAVRIPADVAQTLGLKEGDDVQLHALDAGGVAVVLEKQRRDEALARLAEMQVKLPDDYKFDREELYEGRW